MITQNISFAQRNAFTRKEMPVKCFSFKEYEVHLP